jgi:hypothetical protein
MAAFPDYLHQPFPSNYAKNTARSNQLHMALQNHELHTTRRPSLAHGQDSQSYPDHEVRLGIHREFRWASRDHTTARSHRKEE